MNNDLISRSALLKEIDSCYEDAENYDPCMKKILQRHCLYAKELVDNAPAVDAEPVRHGRWMPYYEPMECFVDVYLNTETRDVQVGWICSECGRHERHSTVEEMPYCHCGAKMDAEVKD